MHSWASLIAERKPVTVLVHTSSSCNILQRGYCKKHGFVVHPYQKELTGFNGSTSKALGLVHVLINIGKCSSVLPCYILNYGTHLIIGYSGLKKMRLFVNCVLDSLVGDNDGRVLCNMVKMGKKDTPKKKNEVKELDMHTSWAHITLTKDVSGVKVVQGGNRLLSPLAGLVVLGPKECVMIIPPFKLSGNGIQNISSVCQTPKILTAMSMRNGENFESSSLIQGVKKG